MIGLAGQIGRGKGGVIEYAGRAEAVRQAAKSGRAIFESDSQAYEPMT